MLSRHIMFPWLQSLDFVTLDFFSATYIPVFRLKKVTCSKPTIGLCSSMFTVDFEQVFVYLGTEMYSYPSAISKKTVRELNNSTAAQ